MFEKLYMFQTQKDIFLQLVSMNSNMLILQMVFGEKFMLKKVGELEDRSQYPISSRTGTGIDRTAPISH